MPRFGSRQTVLQQSASSQPDATQTAYANQKPTGKQLRRKRYYARKKQQQQQQSNKRKDTTQGGGQQKKIATDG